MARTATRQRSDYDPARQWGLKPDVSASTGATYILSGHVVNDGDSSNSMYVSERLGREAQAKAARHVSSRDTERTLETLLKRDKEGMRAVNAARDYNKKMERRLAKGLEVEKRDGKGKQREVDLDSEDDEEELKKPSKNAYSASLIKAIGFDPAAKDGKRAKDVAVEKKVGAKPSS